MSLVKCRECGADVSTTAESCPKCGAPKKAFSPVASIGSPASSAFVLLAVVIAFVFAIKSCGDSDDHNKTASSSQSECAKDDLACIGNKGTIAAGIYCKDKIEALASHSVRWTDGTFEPKFSRFRWKNKSAGIITYIGGKAEFQNGFGAYTPVIYQCDLDSDNKTVLNVSASEGRLPD